MGSTPLEDFDDQITGATDGTKIGNHGDNLNVVDVASSGTDTIISATGTAVEAKVGGSALSTRRYVYLYALDNNIQWGFNTSCNFPLGREGFIAIAADSSCTIYVRSTSGTNDVVVGES